MSPSFVPPRNVRLLRDVTRHGRRLTEERTRAIQRLEKVAVLPGARAEHGRGTAGPPPGLPRNVRSALLGGPELAMRCALRLTTMVGRLGDHAGRSVGAAALTFWWCRSRGRRCCGSRPACSTAWWQSPCSYKTLDPEAPPERRRCRRRHGPIAVAATRYARLKLAKVSQVRSGSWAHDEMCGLRSDLRLGRTGASARSDTTWPAASRTGCPCSAARWPAPCGRVLAVATADLPNGPDRDQRQPRRAGYGTWPLMTHWGTANG